MTARLLCKFGEMKDSEFEIGAEATIGRSHENTIVLGSGAISTEHARIYWDDEAGCYFIEDLDSLNGTQLDGTELTGRQGLRNLHVVNFGRTVEFIFVAGAGPPPEAVAAEGDEPVVEEPEGTRTIVDVAPPPVPTSLAETDEPAAAPGRKRSELDVTLVGYENVSLPHDPGEDTWSEAPDASSAAEAEAGAEESTDDEP